MKEIINPYVNLESYNCFACSPGHRTGLRMSFFEEGEFVASKWKPDPQFAGYSNILHGGIQATLLDEIASWTIQVRKKTAGVTSKMNVRYFKPVRIDQEFIMLKGKIISEKMRLVTVSAELLDEKGVLCTAGEVVYYVFPLDVAVDKYNYPGYDSFYRK